MKLTLLLACLWLDYYFDTGARFRNQTWFENYTRWLKSLLGDKKGFWGGPVSIAIIIIPFFIILELVWGYAGRYSGVVELIVGFAILWFCFGPTTLQEALVHYLKKDTDPNAEQELKMAAGDLVSGPSFNRNVTELIFWQSHERFFGVIFWFLLLGPAGALVFRMIDWMEQNANRLQDDFYPSFPKHMHQIYFLAAWIPVRLAALGYTLTGNFAPGFDQWKRDVVKSNDAREILVASGLASLGAQSATEADREENIKAQHIVQRSLLIWVLVAAIATLGQAFL